MTLYLEQDIEDKFCKWAVKQGGLTYKWEGSRKKVDRIVITHTGTILLIEFKLPSGNLSAHQWELIDEVKKISKRVRVCTSVEQAMEFYYEYCDD